MTENLGETLDRLNIFRTCSSLKPSNNLTLLELLAAAIIQMHTIKMVPLLGERWAVNVS